MKKENIAPCGMNCSVCKAYLREKNPCHSCTFAEQNMPKTRVNCKMRICNKRNGYFCYDCDYFPCDRLKHLDERYRTRYGMSEIENLEFIKKYGVDKFLKKERVKWSCSEGILCVHDKQCYKIFD